ncbi:MAG: FecR domain-containing protein [Pyrinomonadaceae bacterium]|nr:FecR domain-containing protein [Pyrinomonadaceae bacterium]
MVNRSIRFVFCIAMAFCMSSAAFAQERRVVSAAGDKYVISANAGGVNFVEGSVTVARKEGRSGLLLKGDQIEIGDRVSTGADGKAEILLNPGSYVRLGTNTTFAFNTTLLDDLRLRVDSGSAMFEVFATNEFKVTVILPKGSVTLIDTGIYRVDVSPNGTSKVAVWDGRAEIPNSTSALKKGRAATIGLGSPAVAKFDRDEKDALAVWSKQRGKMLTKATASLKNQSVRDSLINSYNSGRWGIFDAFGVWVYNAQFGGHCFLPFGRGWYSPYGYWFGNNIWWYDLPTVIYYPVTPAPSIYGTKNRTRENETGGGSGGGEFVPPFVRAQEGIKMNDPVRVPSDNNTDRSPVFFPSSPQVVVAAPSPTGTKTRDN